MVKKIILIAAVLFAFQHRHTIMAFINPPPDYAAAHDGKVILYSTSWCGYCFRLKKILKNEGITYTEVDIEFDPAAAEFVASVNGGNQTVPTLKFPDGSTLTNPSGAQVKAKLAG